MTNWLLIHGLACCRVPQTNNIVGTGRSNPFPIAAESEAVDAARSFEAEQLLAGFDIPNAHCVILARNGQEPSVGAQRVVLDGGLVRKNADQLWTVAQHRCNSNPMRLLALRITRVQPERLGKPQQSSKQLAVIHKACSIGDIQAHEISCRCPPGPVSLVKDA